jgi:hypothetical protein
MRDHRRGRPRGSSATAVTCSPWTGPARMAGRGSIGSEQRLRDARKRRWRVLRGDCAAGARFLGARRHPTSPQWAVAGRGYQQPESHRQTKRSIEQIQTLKRTNRSKASKRLHRG